MPESVDVAVVGGGPAGAAAAISLCRHTPLRVAVLEASAYDGPRVGETLSPSIQGLLSYLGVWEAFAAQGHLPAFGTAAAWGGADLAEHSFLFTGRGEGWHVDRGRFDRMLAEAVAGAGGWLGTGLRVVGCAREGRGPWRLSWRGQSGGGTLGARFLIEASGQRGTLGRILGAVPDVCDRLLGIVGFVAGRDAAEGSAGALVEAVPDGWWYAAALPSGRAVAALMTDAGAARALGTGGRLSAWWDLLAATRHVRRVLEAAGPPAALHVRPAYSRLLRPLGGPGWVAAGDAAASFDPLSSMGVGHALHSGIHAARVACDQLMGDGRLLRAFEDAVEAHFARYLELRRLHYRLEQRWVDRPFWAARHRG